MYHSLHILLAVVEYLLNSRQNPYLSCHNLDNCRVYHKQGIDKRLLIILAHGFNSQFLNLFGFSISVSFDWCII